MQRGADFLTMVALEDDTLFSELDPVFQRQVDAHIALNHKAIVHEIDAQGVCSISLKSTIFGKQHNTLSNLLQEHLGDEFTVGFLADVFRKCDMDEVVDWLAVEVLKWR